MNKHKRMENKKRKTAALVNIIKINEKDKKLEKQSLVNENNEFKEKDLNEEPICKKVKTDDDDEMLNSMNKSISDEQYKILKNELQMRKNALNNVPKFRLKFFGDKARLLNSTKTRQPLMFEDIQYLLMSALLGSSSPFKPDRWCVLEKPNKITHTVILVIEGLTSYNFIANESLFVKTKGIFEDQLEVILPKSHKCKLIEELSYVPLTQTHKEMLIKKFGSLEAAMKLNKNPNDMFAKSLFPIDSDDDTDKLQIRDGETFPRTRLLLSPLQMMIEGYPMPLKGEYEEKYKDYRYTKNHYKPVSVNSPMFGLDCEMCRTVKAENELARVSIVDENYKSIYETLVKPDNKITNYLTPWSGITKEMMENVTKTLTEVQDEVSALLPSDAILVGQSLNCDLSAMKLMHPYVIDTSVIFNLSGDRNRKSKLQLLAKQFLQEDIQIDKAGHSSIEDSTACLKLTKLKLSKDIYFGDLALQTKKSLYESKKIVESGIVKNDENNASMNVKTPLFSHAIKRQKKSVIISTEKCNVDLKKFYSKNQFSALSDDSTEHDHGIKHHKETTVKKVIKKAREIAIDNDFNICHFNVFEDLLNDEDSDSSYQCVEDANDDEMVAQIIPKIDKWIEKVYSKVASSGLFVVLFGGRENNSNGLSMIQIKN